MFKNIVFYSVEHKHGECSMRKVKKTAKKKASAKKKVAKKKVARKAVAKKRSKRIRCMAKTKDGKQCKRFTDGKSKLCSVHKKK